LRQLNEHAKRQAGSSRYTTHAFNHQPGDWLPEGLSVLVRPVWSTGKALSRRGTAKLPLPPPKPKKQRPHITGFNDRSALRGTRIRLARL